MWEEPPLSCLSAPSAAAAPLIPPLLPLPLLLLLLLLLLSQPALDPAFSHAPLDSSALSLLCSRLSCLCSAAAPTDLHPLSPCTAMDMSGMMNNPMMGQLMQRLQSDPELMQLISQPDIMAKLQQIMQNPATAQQVSAAHTQHGSNSLPSPTSVSPADHHGEWLAVWSAAGDG